MTKITQMPKIVLTYLSTGLTILLFRLFTSGNIDIAIHETYFIIPKIQIIVALFQSYMFFALVTWGIYYTSRRLSSVLNWLHFGLTTITLVIIVVLTQNLTSQTKTYRDYNVHDEFGNYESQISMNEWLVIIGVILVLSQSFFLINIIRAFLVKRESL